MPKKPKEVNGNHNLRDSSLGIRLGSRTAVGVGENKVSVVSEVASGRIMIVEITAEDNAEAVAGVGGSPDLGVDIKIRVADEKLPQSIPAVTRKKPGPKLGSHRKKP